MTEKSGKTKTDKYVDIVHSKMRKLIFGIILCTGLVRLCIALLLYYLLNNNMRQVAQCELA